MADETGAKPFEVVPYPAPILYQRAEAVAPEEIDDELRVTLQRMFATMYENRGVGLAAPQVGISKRFFIANPGPEDEAEADHDGQAPHEPEDAVTATEPAQPAETEYVFINPEILEPLGSQVDEEGCLSIRGVRGQVNRADTLRVRALNERGEPFELEASGFFARVIQHETDHLNGELFIDKISPAEKVIAEKQLRQLRHEWEEREQRQAEKSKLRRGVFGHRGSQAPAKKRRLKRR